MTMYGCRLFAFRISRQIAIVLCGIFAFAGCELGTFESLDKDAAVATDFFGVNGIRRDVAGNYSLFWKNPSKAENPRIIIYYLKLEDGLQGLPGASEIADLSEKLKLPATLYQAEGENTPAVLGEIVTEVANRSESAQIGFPLDPTMHHAFQLLFVDDSGVSDSNRVTLVLGPTAENFDGCVAATAIDDATIKVDYQRPPNALRMTIFRNGIPTQVVEGSDSGGGSFLDKDLDSDAEYTYSCQASFTDKEVMGQKKVTATTIDPLKGVGFKGCKEAVAISGSIIQVTFDFPKEADKVQVFENGTRRYESRSPTDTKFEHTRLEEGQTYYYSCQVTIRNKQFFGEKEVSAKTIVTNPPTFAGINAVEIEKDGVKIKAKLSWNPASGIPAERYDIYAVAGSVIDWETPVLTATPAELTAEIPGLGDDLAYSFAVRACSAETICDPNEVIHTVTTPDTGAPQTVGVTKAEVIDGNIVLTLPWEIKQGGIARRKIYQRIGALSGTDISKYDLELTKLVVDATNPATTIVLTGTLEDTTYHFIARDMDVHGNENQNTKIVTISTSDLTPPFFSGISSLARKPGENDRTLIAEFSGVSDESAEPRSGAAQYLVYVAEPVPLPAPPAPIPAGTGDPCEAGTLLMTIDNDDSVSVGVPYSFELTGLDPRSQHHVCIRAIDSYGNISDNSNSIAMHTTDLTPPTFDGLQDIRFNGTNGTLDLGWNPSPSSDINEYIVRIWKNDNVNPVKTIISKSHAEFELGANITSSEYPLDSADVIYTSVDACDNAGLIDGGVQNCTASTVVKVVSLPDIEAPENFVGIKSPADLGTPAEGEVLIKWFNPTVADWESQGYRGFTIYTLNDSVLQFLKDCPCVATDCSDKPTQCLVKGLDPYRNYTFHVRAYDSAGNVTQTDLSSSSSKRTSDTTPPTFNSNLAVALVSGKVNLTWSAATDNQYDPSAKIRYQIWRLEQDTKPYPSPEAVTTGSWSNIATVTDLLAYTDSNLNDDRRYHYSICALDATWAFNSGLDTTNRRCDGTIKFVTLADINPPIIEDFATNKGVLDSSWLLSWKMYDHGTGNENPVTSRLYRKISSEPIVLTLADIEAGDYDLLLDVKSGTVIGGPSDFQTTDVGPQNTATFVNYILVVEDAALNRSSATLSVFSDTEITITKVSRNIGRVNGGNLVVIEGKGFIGGFDSSDPPNANTSVTIGGFPCTDVNVFIEGKSPLPAAAVNDEGSMLVCTVPEAQFLSPGAKDVVVTLLNGSLATKQSAYTYCDPTSDCTNVCDINYLSPGNPFEGGDGSQGNPYQICTVDQWARIDQNSGSYFILQDNLDLSGFTVAGGYTGEINSLEDISAGTYSLDGNDFVVANYTNSTSTTVGGLINASRNSIYKDLGVVNVTISRPGTVTVGGLVAYSVSNSYENVYVAGGTLSGGKVGGVTGESFVDTMHNVGSFNDASGANSVGGISALSKDSSNASRLYFSGNLTSTSSQVGGLIGRYYGNPSGKISDSNAIGSVGGTSNVGGLIGISQASPVILRSKFSGDVNATSSSGAGGIVGRIDMELRDAKFIEVSAEGTVSGQGRVGGLLGSVDVKSGSNQSLLLSNAYFTGSVSNTDNSETGGILGVLLGGDLTIRQTRAMGSINGQSEVGGFVGSVVINDGDTSSHISESSSSMVISATGNLVGGFIGTESTTVVDDGIPDYQRVYATGSVTSSANNVGGFAGKLVQEVEDSYTTAAVAGNLIVGGFVGIADSFNMNRNFSAGLVTKASGGGFIGSLVGTPPLANNYWDLTLATTNVSPGTAVGELEAKTTVQMQTEGTFSGWDFSNGSGVWQISPDEYPKLQWENTGWSAWDVQSACSSSGGAKTLRVYIMNPSQTNDMEILSGGISVTDGEGAIVSNNSCTGTILAAPFGTCSFDVSYSTTPATNTASATVDVANTGFFLDINLTTEDIDNSCP